MKRAAAPYMVWMFIFTVIPMLLISYYAFSAPGDGFSLTTAHMARAFEPVYLLALWRSVWLALIATAICLLIGYPTAYIMAGKEFDNRSTLLFLFLVPMWMNFLLRTYSWLTILEQNGLINNLLTALGLPKMMFLNTKGAVVLGMVYNFLPFMILPIYTVLKKMDQSIIEAAQDLGADKRRVFTRVVFPLSIPGIMSGITMVFMPSVTTFIIPVLLGGGKELLIGNLIEMQFLKIGDWNFGSALSVILMVVILISMAFINAADSEELGGSLF